VARRSPLTRTSSPSALSGEGLDRLLALLDRDRDQAGLKYEALRRKLLRFFEWRDLSPADELTDETLDRVSRRLLEGVEVHLGPAAYVYGVARNVAREAVKRSIRRPHPVPLGDEAEDAADPASVEPAAEEEEVEGALHCLDRCLETLPIEMRRFVLLYHSRDRGAPTERLQEALGIPPGAVWVRMHRLRKRLERCVRDCQEGRSTGPATGNRQPGHSSTGGGRGP
jgi:DNA-directed RNA polymerase specialized sigma24 family protein